LPKDTREPRISRRGRKTQMNRAKMNRTSLAQVAAFSLLFSLLLQPSNANSQECGGKIAPSDLRRCEEMFARKVAAGSRTSQLPGGWRLVKTPDPRRGPDAVSVLHTADTAKSDPNFAGLTFRCGQAGIETLLILLQPLARGSRYGVLLKGGSIETQLEAKAVQGGEVLLLPPSATALASRSWQAAPELTVDVAAPSPIRGSVPTAGLAGALLELSQSCPAH
jgi:hypothetical protein